MEKNFKIIAMSNIAKENLDRSFVEISLYLKTTITLINEQKGIKRSLLQKPTVE